MNQALPLRSSAGRKSVFTAIMGALTGVSLYGCYWQYSRYLESSRRWNSINQSLEQFDPVELRGIDAKYYPWYRNDNLKDWEYKLVKIRGYFKDQRFFVRRTRDGRQGYLVFAPFITAIQNYELEKVNEANKTTEHGIFVNLGWVPLENKKDITLEVPIQPLEADENAIFLDNFDNLTGLRPGMENEPDSEQQYPITEITGIVRKGENQDILNGKRNWPQEGVYQFVDLKFMSRFFRLFNLESASEAYIERLIQSYESEGEELYPVPTTKDNFDKPYLTPTRHRDYSMFWGGASFIGILSILSQIRK